VTPALLLGALATLLWPGAGRRNRLAGVTALSARRSRRRRDDLPVAPVAALVAAALAALVSTALVAVLAGVVAFAGARAWLGRRRDDRTEVELSALTEGLGALAADLRSGRSLEAATDAAVAACGDEVCGRGLALAIRAPAAGPTVRGQGPVPGEALRDALDRISAAVRLSTRTGCSLAAVASAVEDDLRARQRHRRELRSVTAAPRASAALLAGLPLVGLAMGSGVGADPWRVLTTTGPGQVLLVAGVMLELAGLAWTARLVRRAVG
jgi:tight adherence protein B